MAYNAQLAERVRAGLKRLPIVEKRMFGGIGYLIHGNMACGVYQEDLIVRFDPDKHDRLIKRAHVKPFDITGKPMKGWLMVEPQGCRTPKQLASWITEGVEFALTLPAK